MKTIITTVIVATVLGTATPRVGAFGTAALLGEETPTELAQRQVEAAQEQVETQVQAQLAQVGRQIELAQAAVAPPEPPEPPLAPEAPFDSDSGFAGKLEAITGSIFGNSARTVAQPLVIGPIATDATALSHTQEDLMVMSRILNKAIEPSGERDKQDLVSGIFISTFANSRRPQSLYLEGYGALFLLGVKFPLVPPSAIEEVKLEKPADTTWEKTKRELFGPHNPPHSAWMPNSRRESRPVKFEAQRVETLKQNLLDALRNAANLRHLKPDDQVVVAVTGSPGGAATGMKQLAKKGLRSAPKSGDNTVEIYTVTNTDDEMPHNTALVIRVKKADVDALAQGKLDFEQFQKKAAITAY